MRFSLIEISIPLTVAFGYAQLFGELHPEHAEAVNQFCKRVARSRTELQASIEEKEQSEQEGHDGTDAR